MTLAELDVLHRFAAEKATRSTRVAIGDGQYGNAADLLAFGAMAQRSRGRVVANG